jgi:hypothetical protein
MMNERFDNPTNLDRELLMLAGEIDKLALEDMPRAGFEDRIFAATMPVLSNATAAQEQPRLVLVGTQAEVRRRVNIHAPMRLAASLALLVTVGAVWLANRPATVPSVSKSPVDDWAVATNLFDDSSAKELDQIATDTAGLDDRIRSMNVGDLMLDEGAM